MKKLVTAKEAAQMYQVNIQTIWKWIRKDQIPYVRHGRTVRVIVESNWKLH